MTARNKRVLLKSRPVGWVTLENFEIVEEPAIMPKDGEIQVRNLFLSLDPYMRGRMNAAKSYAEPYPVGEVMKGGVIGQVTTSNSPEFNVGDIVTGLLGWEEYSIADDRSLRLIESPNIPLSYHLGILGMPGMTAYHGLMKIGEPRDGETVFVSAASGAVGSVVGQLAKLMGCRVVGCAGSDKKVSYLVNDLGFDAAFNYKTCGDINDTLKRLCPDGIDIDFENVGGEILEAVLWNMNDFGRMAMCGMIGDYNAETLSPGPRGMFMIVSKRLRLQGFIILDNPESCAEYLAKAPAWLADGKLKYHESIATGIEAAPEAFIGMLKGQNFGKQLVRIADL